MFDDCLRERPAREGAAYVPFDAVHDYGESVNGRPREDGVRTFLAARGVRLPEGAPDGQPRTQTVNGPGTRKNNFLVATVAAGRAPAVDEDAAAVLEDALAGAEAGRTGRFGLVVGVAGVGQAEHLRAHGADVVVRDLDELLEAR
ncbi:hydrolase [Streptomyces collinus Tu 365]|uniref:Hydrolase n=2 Tax=Streptomyces collinus TaxID=42684 RepID=S5UK28_STRC3|nr:hydrolase [Streptomyces collinus Tu 365]AGS73491.1 hydrolase [Streptomyces collinus Tu 365]